MATNTKTQNKQIKIKLFAYGEEFNKGVQTYAKQAVKTQELAHSLAVSALIHLEKHRNINVVRQVIEATPQGVRKQALVNWFVKFGKVSLDKEIQVTENGREVERNVLNFDKKKASDLDGAKLLPFWKVKAPKAKAKKEFNFEIFKEKMIKLTQEARKARTEDGACDIPLDIIQVIESYFKV